VLAVDTNVVVRFLTADEPLQAERARTIFKQQAVLLLKTVLLEAEWVLRSSYRFDRSHIADAFTALLGLPTVICEEVSAVSDAIRWMRRGLDFADALHLASARPAGSFATFDGDLANRAVKITDITMIRA